MPFVKGKSGNPAGREPGKTSELDKALKRVSGDMGFDLLDRALLNLGDAIDANEPWAIQWLLNKKFASPKLIGRNVVIPKPLTGSLDERAEQLLHLGTTGVLSVEETSQLLTALGAMVRIKEITEIEAEFQRLENEK